MKAVEAKRLILTRGIPKTGQTDIVAEFSDGLTQAGWWFGRKVADNKTRFIPKTLSGDAVVFDRATGLVWPASALSLACNNGGVIQLFQAMENANNLTFAGFTDWRIPNIKELISLADYGTSEPTIDTEFFSYTRSGFYWTSTIDAKFGADVYAVNFGLGQCEILSFGGNYYMRAVRGGL